MALAALFAALLPAGAGADHSQSYLVSTGPDGGNGAFRVAFSGASADGKRVFFRTDESLVASDTDYCSWAAPPRPCFDVYERSNGTTTLTSTGPVGGNGAFDAFFAASSTEGSSVFFTTTEALVANDDDNTSCVDETGVTPCADIYERSAGTTTLASSVSGPFNPTLETKAESGPRFLFTTTDPALPADQDVFEDLYEQSGGTMSLVTTGSSGGNGAFDALWSGNSADLSRVFFRTGERLVSADSDDSGDVYEHSGGGTTLISTGPAGGNGPESSAFAGASADGTRVFFTTQESLVAADTDSAEDVYQRSAGSTTLVSTGPSGNGASHAFFAGASDDGTRVLFRTRSALAGGDTDSSVDVYERSGGTTKLMSIGAGGGNGAFDAYFAGASDDGTRVFLLTAEGLVATDTDGRLDVYQRQASTTTLVSTGPGGGNGPFDAYFAGASGDGTRVFLHTDEPLVSEDTDGLQDIYERQGGATTRISAGPNGGNGSAAAFYTHASEDGTRVFFYTGEQLVGADTDSSNDIYVATAQTGYARPRSASPINVKLVPAYKTCSSPNGAHGMPLEGASCSPPVPESDQLTVGTPDANGKGANLVGQITLRAVGESPIDPGNGDQADVQITADVSDVRRRSNLSDYLGELEARMEIRITDRLNGGSLTDPATVSDAPFSFPVPCVPTPDIAIGSKCSLSTTADAMVPGIVIEGKRAIWQLEQLEILDGGVDDDADTPPNTPFLRQGVFAP